MNDSKTDTTATAPPVAPPNPGALRYRRSRHYFAQSGVVAADVAVFLLSFAIIRSGPLATELILYQFSDSGQLVGSTNTGIDLYFPLCALGIVYFLIKGHYTQRQPFWDEVYTVLKAVLVLAMLDLVLLAAASHPGARIWVLVDWVLVLFALPVARILARHAMLRLGCWQIPTAIVGTGENAFQTCLALRDERLLGYDVRVVIDIVDGSGAPLPPGETGSFTVKNKRLPLVRVNADDLPAYIHLIGDPHVIVAIEDQFSTDFAETVSQLSSARPSVDIVPSMRGLPLYGLETAHFFGKEILMLRARNNLYQRPQQNIKRAFDLVAASALLLLVTPLIAWIAWRVRGEDGGAVFYCQERVGRNGTPFGCWKFRSMIPDAEAQLARWRDEGSDMWRRYTESNFKLHDDPRVTRTGRWLRAWSLDELPQLWNVLRGEMSLVGPRPLLEREVPAYGKSYRLYTQVRPGITGLWQVSGRSQTEFRDRARYDEWYIKNWALWYDVVFLFKTVSVVWSRRGAF
jgi:Undecaprenyl-phosphate galactose phosphotransferase WbaP